MCSQIHDIFVFALVWYMTYYRGDVTRRGFCVLFPLLCNRKSALLPALKLAGVPLAEELQKEP